MPVLYNKYEKGFILKCQLQWKYETLEWPEWGNSVLCLPLIIRDVDYGLCSLRLILLFYLFADPVLQHVQKWTTLNQNISLKSCQANDFGPSQKMQMLYIQCVEQWKKKFPLIRKSFIALPCDGTALNVNMVSQDPWFKLNIAKTKRKK